MSAEKPKRRWFRFSLRTLLVFVMISGVCFGWLGMKVRQGQRQEEAVEVIEKLGGRVVYDYWFDENGQTIDDPSPPGPTWLRRLVGDHVFINVIHVDLSGCNATDETTIHLRKMHNLGQLMLNSTHITDVGLANLTELKELYSLNIGDNKITDAGLAHLVELRKLDRLELEGTQITDAGLRYLNDLDRLQWLFLDDTQVSRAGYQSLQRRLPDLRGYKPRVDR